MWAIRWFDCDGVQNPIPWKYGAWMLCASRTMAKGKRISDDQVITRVRVKILP